MKRGSSAAGTNPSKMKVRIVIIQDLDDLGQPIPGQYKYGVATYDIPPQIIHECGSFEDAVNWAISKGYAVGNTPQP